MTIGPAAAQYSEDIAAFADIGTDPPTIEPTSDGFAIRFIRLGDPTELSVSSRNDAILETFGQSQIKHVNFKALLASERYGALRDWAAKQTAFLTMELERSGVQISISGLLNSDISPKKLEQVDDLLVAPRAPESTRVMLIDGPAGIGKTQFILNLAARRAGNYTTERRPLILHVQSRGRQLSYIFDLIAFNLQRLRIEVTYDQIPILAKYGLVTIAIDGFDELADPDGYDLAWSQVNELVAKLRGSGTMILAGRETFIGRDRVIKDIPTLKSEVDDISVLTLRAPSKGDALKWLEGQGWSEEQLNLIESFLEPSSMALRPFFLKTLADNSIAARIQETESTNVVSILMEAMIEREATKFGEAVERSLTKADRQNYVKSLMEEVARDIAENSSVSVSEATLMWLADVALPSHTPDDIRRILKARSSAVAFLTNDERPGYKRFYHEKFFEYFLATVLIDTLSKKEVAKPLARNILGTSFLETFGTVVSSGVPEELAHAFLQHSVNLLATYPPIDRTRKNIGALVISSLSIASLVHPLKMEGVDMDEARFSGTAEVAELVNVVISQFDCRGADISAVQFRSSTIVTLIGDDQTLLPNDFPTPHRIQDTSSNSGSIANPIDIKKWIENHLLLPPEKETGLIPKDMKDHPALKLLSKVCRYRQYWLRRGDDVHVAKILNDDYWPILERTLSANNLLRVENRDASGTDARFIHVRQTQDILAEDFRNEDVRKFYSQLLTELRAS